MSAPRACRVLITDPAPGPWNMALDEALLEDAAAGVPTLRFYQWSEPTLSLGYFQTAASRAGHPASGTCQLVRRASGGGAILHDRELTYSLAIPSAWAAAKDAEALYLLVHRSLLAELEVHGIRAALNEQKSGLGRDDEPFLCFQRRAVGDVLFASHKIGGSAQRRHHGTVLQHGSVILRMSAKAPELPGIRELAGVDLGFQELAELWLPEIVQKTGLEPRFGELTAKDRAQASQIKAGKFATREWLNRR